MTIATTTERMDVEQLVLHVRELQTAINLMAGATLRANELDPKLRRRLEQMLNASREMHATAEQMACTAQRPG